MKLEILHKPDAAETNVMHVSGVKIHGVDIAGAIGKVEEFIRSGQRHQVCVTNAYSVVLMQNDREYREINNESSLIVADGMPLVWASRLLKRPITERVAGYDLFHGLCARAEKTGYTFFLLGATDKTLVALSAKLHEEFPDLRIKGAYAPSYTPTFTEEENRKIRECINQAKPDILWVGMTAPKQEKWIHDNLAELDVRVAIGVGAVFDFVSGNKSRAPVWMQKTGLEWFWRFIQEPGRLWRRYLIGNIVFIWLMLKEFFRRLFLSLARRNK